MGVDHSKYQNAVETPVIEKKEVPVVSEKAPESKPFGHPKTGTPGKCPLGFGSSKKAEEKKIVPNQAPQEVSKEAVQTPIKVIPAPVKEETVAPKIEKKECSMGGQCQFMKDRKSELNSLPVLMTEAKFTLLFDNFTLQQRCLAVGFSTILVGLASRKALNFSMLETVRNSFLGFYGVGLVVAPEIYNPKMFRYE